MTSKNKKKARVQFRCQDCGYAAPRAMGQCPECSAWNSMSEELVEDRGASAPASRGLADFTSAPTSLSELASRPDAESRSATGIAEFDRLLGGGLVPGQVVLLAGPPGIGKSTLMLQAAAGLCPNLKTLYVSGEESMRQVSSRAQRLGLSERPIVLLSETDLSRVLEVMDDLRPGFVILDSVQTVYHPQWPGTPGSVTQVRECSAELLRTAKSRDAVVFLLGHVTKEGALAGPKLLEHLVDTVLYFDTERHDLLRVLRARKNRFGPTDEVGLFEMGEGGLKQMDKASAFFLEEVSPGTCGRAVSAAMEGSRPMLAEAQSLVVSTRYPLPRRTATGLDYNRVLMLLAAMEKHLRLRLEDKDVFVSLAGGLKISDPALDLAVCMAILSSDREKALPLDMVFIGEVGLLGEIGRVPCLENRLREAAKAGFKRALVPARADGAKGRATGLETIPVRSLREAADALAAVSMRVTAPKTGRKEEQHHS